MFTLNFRHPIGVASRGRDLCLPPSESQYQPNSTRATRRDGQYRHSPTTRARNRPRRDKAASAAFPPPPSRERPLAEPLLNHSNPPGRRSKTGRLTSSPLQLFVQMDIAMPWMDVVRAPEQSDRFDQDRPQTCHHQHRLHLQPLRSGIPLQVPRMRGSIRRGLGNRAPLPVQHGFWRRQCGVEGRRRYVVRPQGKLLVKPSARAVRQPQKATYEPRLIAGR